MTPSRKLLMKAVRPSRNRAVWRGHPRATGAVAGEIRQGWPGSAREARANGGPPVREAIGDRAECRSVWEFPRPKNRGSPAGFEGVCRRQLRGAVPPKRDAAGNRHRRSLERREAWPAGHQPGRAAERVALPECRNPKAMEKKPDSTERRREGTRLPVTPLRLSCLPLLRCCAAV
jgi:hypothetical protein